MYSASPSSTTRPPVSRLLSRMARRTCASGRSYASSFIGSTVTWYCLTKPPMLATSLTPSTAVSSGFR